GALGRVGVGGVGGQGGRSGKGEEGGESQQPGEGRGEPFLRRAERGKLVHRHSRLVLPVWSWRVLRYQKLGSRGQRNLGEIRARDMTGYLRIDQLGMRERHHVPRGREMPRVNAR